jgi:hypothetical protein
VVTRLAVGLDVLPPQEYYTPRDLMRSLQMESQPGSMSDLCVQFPDRVTRGVDRPDVQPPSGVPQWVKGLDAQSQGGHTRRAHRPYMQSPDGVARGTSRPYVEPPGGLMNRAERLDAQPPVGVDCCAGAATTERPLHADVGVQSLPRRQFYTVHTLLDGC